MSAFKHKEQSIVAKSFSFMQEKADLSFFSYETGDMTENGYMWIIAQNQNECGDCDQSIVAAYQDKTTLNRWVSMAKLVSCFVAAGTHFYCQTFNINIESTTLIFTMLGDI